MTVYIGGIKSKQICIEKIEKTYSYSRDFIHAVFTRLSMTDKNYKGKPDFNMEKYEEGCRLLKEAFLRFAEAVEV